jgi:hypothetical protein
MRGGKETRLAESRARLQPRERAVRWNRRTYRECVRMAAPGADWSRTRDPTRGRSPSPSRTPALSHTTRTRPRSPCAPWVPVARSIANRMLHKPSLSVPCGMRTRASTRGSWCPVEPFHNRIGRRIATGRDAQPLQLRLERLREQPRVVHLDHGDRGPAVQRNLVRKPAVEERMGDEGVPGVVRRQSADSGCLPCSGPMILPPAVLVEWPAACVQPERFVCRRDAITAVFAKHLDDSVREVDRPGASARLRRVQLPVGPGPPHAQRAPLEVDVTPEEPQGLRDAESRPEEQVHERVVLWPLRLEILEQSLPFGVVLAVQRSR